MRFSRVLPLIAFAACASRTGSQGAQSPDGAVAGGRAAEIVNATIVTNGCQTLGAANGRLAERAMYDLVESCTSIPGGSAQFYATLQPGGRIEIASGRGQPEMIPTCVVKHSLLHKVPLSRPCGIQVRLEETRVPLAVDAGPGG